MSIDHSAVLLYGFSIRYPDHDEDDSWQTHVDRIIRGLGFTRPEWDDPNGVGYAEVGPYDGDRLYLCTAYHSVDLTDDPEKVPVGRFDAETYARWDGMLNATARKLGIEEHATPEWVLMVNED